MRYQRAHKIHRIIEKVLLLGLLFVAQACGECKGNIIPQLRRTAPSLAERSQICVIFQRRSKRRAAGEGPFSWEGEGQMMLLSGMQLMVAGATLWCLDLSGLHFVKTEMPRPIVNRTRRGNERTEERFGARAEFGFAYPPGKDHFSPGPGVAVSHPARRLHVFWKAVRSEDLRNVHRCAALARRSFLPAECVRRAAYQGGARNGHSSHFLGAGWRGFSRNYFCNHHDR
jgi:hypothetical protein